MAANYTERALTDERHLGWGLATMEGLNEADRRLLTELVDQRAEVLGLTHEAFFHWSNSKPGRWMVDQAYGATPAQMSLAVERYLTPENVEKAIP